jgi:hypothetical protein
MDRTNYTTRLTTLKNQNQEHNYDHLTAEERLKLVWPLTVELLSLTENFDAESRLQRHIAKLSRLKS